MAKKDSYWFRHDSNAGRGLKMRKMAHIHNHWGKGVYWDVCEVLRDQSGYKFESNEDSLKMLCDIIGCKEVDRFLIWFKDCIKYELFIDEGGYFYSDIQVKHMAIWETKKTNGAKKRKGSGKEAETTSDGDITEHNRTQQNTTEKYIITIGNEKFNKKVSEILTNEYASLFEACMMTTHTGVKPNVVLLAMDKRYPIYDFEDQNHLLRAVQAIKLNNNGSDMKQTRKNQPA